MQRWLMIVLALTFSACGLVVDRESRVLAAGYTPCNDFPDPTDGVVCHPNQYCASQKNQWCSTGCLSDDNCSLEQICVKSHSQNSGQCMAIDTLPDPDPDLSPGQTQCGDPTDPNHYEICEPSHYCYSYYFGDCSRGCASDANCPLYELCIKPKGESIGACERVE